MSDRALLKQLLSQTTFRCIGPPRGGRVVAAAGDAKHPAVFYFGAVAGGVWKTTDAGVTWECISDGQIKTSSVGAIDVSPSDTNVIYVGMGETTIRTDVSYGDGVYKSTDAGRTWAHLGLADTRHIGRVKIHPRNPEIVFVAALGHAFGTNEERGVFRTRDGGKSWQKVLFKSERAGAADLSLDEQNPDIVYASIWQARRGPWYNSSGGDDGGLWKSIDGGDSWVEITLAKGLPATGLIGKIGLAASPVQAGRVWAQIESQVDPGLYRSDDFGASWTLVCDKPELRRRPWYYMHVVADTQDPDTVWVSNLDLHKSIDGGKSFTMVPTPHGDNHALWIDPNDNQRMVQGNDGGACVSFNGGLSFSSIYNQNTAQFYHLDVDDAFPYNVYSTQQDNSSIAIPSDTTNGAITFADCFVAGTGESGYIAVDPKDRDVVYVGAVGSSPGGLGSLQRFDRRTGQIQLINVWPQIYGGDIALKSMKYRFPWTFPILFSPHDPKILYTCGNIAFRSSNDGHSWEAFSPDLTRNDPTKQEPSGGPITLDSSAAEHYCTIYTFRESPREKGLFWAGSDDGLIHISRDDGATWQNVTPGDLPEWAWIRTVEPSPHDAATCYVAATRYKLDDTTPYLFKTSDYGSTWSRISGGIEAGDYVRVVRADPNRLGILYCGTESGLYISLDDGASWDRWQANFPIAPVYDLKVKDADLVVATHGRSAWIADDLTPLYHWLDGALESDGVRLVSPRAAWRVLPDLFADWIPNEGRVYGIGMSSIATYIAGRSDTGHPTKRLLDAGEGAPRGALITYVLPQDLPAEGTVRLEFLDGSGQILRSYGPKPAGYDKKDDKEKSMDPGPWIAVKPGVNRFLWNLHMTGAEWIPGVKTAMEIREGPLVLPGRYTARLTVGDNKFEASFDVRNDARVTTPLADMVEQQGLILRIRDTVSRAHRAVIRLRSAREQAELWRRRSSGRGEILAAIDALLTELAAVEEVLIIPGEQKEIYHLTQRPRLTDAISSLVPVVGTADARPTVQAAALVDEYSALIDEQIALLDAALASRAATVSRLIGEAKLPAIEA